MARLKGTTELRIKEHNLKGKTLPEVREEVKDIKFDKGITVLALQPEIGKTHSFIKYCQDNPDKNIAYFAPNHDLLNEVEGRLKEQSLTGLHWYGINKICKRYLDKDPYVLQLNNIGLSIHSFCESSCEYKDNCQHKNQFNYEKPAIILAPSAYLGTHYVKDFDTVFVDEFSKDCKACSWALVDSELKQAVRILWNIGYSPVLDDFLRVIDNPDHLNEIDLPELKRAFQRGINKSILELNDFKLLSKVLSDINKSVEFLEWKNIYKKSDGYEKSLKTYYKPYIYKLFELAESIPVVLMDATFNKELFTDLLSGYDGEFGIKNKFDINIYYSQVQNKESMIYKIYPTAWYPQSSITVNLIKDAKNLYNLYTKIGKKVGIITSKDIEETEFFGYETLHYNNLRGQNKFKDFDVLILLGTYQPNIIGIIQDHNKLYLTDLIESTKIRYFKTDEEADNFAKTRDEKYGEVKNRVDSAVIDLKDAMNYPIDTLSEVLFSWDIPIKEHIWLFVREIMDINGVKNPDMQWFFTANIEKTPDGKTLKMYDESHVISFTLEKDNLTLTLNDGKVHTFPAKMNEGSLSIFIPYKKKYRYPDGRRKLVRTKRQRNEEIGEFIKADLIQEINRENELIQAIYRIRPLNEEKPKIIYVWGIVPDCVKDELWYEEIEDIDPIIRKLKQELIDRCNPESYFEEGKRISAIEDAIVKDTDCSPYQAEKMRKEFLAKSNIWKIGKKKIPGSDKPVYVIKKKIL